MNDPSREETPVIEPDQIEQIRKLAKRWQSDQDRGTTHWTGCELEHPRCAVYALLAYVEQITQQRDERLRTQDCPECQQHTLVHVPSMQGWLCVVCTHRGEHEDFERAEKAEAQLAQITHELQQAQLLAEAHRQDSELVDELERESGEIRTGARTFAALRAELAQITHARNRLLAGKFTRDEIHAICHNLHGTVGAQEFADGCAAEQQKLYGCAPDRQRAEKAEAQLQTLSEGRARLEQALRLFAPGSHDGLWGRIKAHVVNGAAQRDEGIRLARQITEWQIAVDDALAPNVRSPGTDPAPKE